MKDEPYDVPATGVVDYQMFVVDPGWTEDKWISAIEPRPGNPSVVHHILLFVIPPDGNMNGGLGSGNDFLGAFAPGLRPEPLPDGLGPLRAGRLEVDFPDALHAQRLGAKGSQLLRFRVRRSQDGEEGSARDQRGQRRLPDSARATTILPCKSRYIFTRGLDAADADAAHASARQGVSLRGHVSRRQEGSACSTCRATTSAGRRAIAWPSPS